MLAIARSSFYVPPDDARFTVRLGDGAEWVARPGPPADAVVVDGYDGDSQVAELCTPRFYEGCRQRLAAGGVLVVNLWGSDGRFDEYLRRIESAFPGATLCLPAEKPGNVIVFGFRDSPGSAQWDALSRKAGELEARYGLEFGRFVRGFSQDEPQHPGAPVHGAGSRAPGKRVTAFVRCRIVKKSWTRADSTPGGSNDRSRWISPERRHRPM